MTDGGVIITRAQVGLLWCFGMDTAWVVTGTPIADILDQFQDAPGKLIGVPGPGADYVVESISIILARAGGILFQVVYIIGGSPYMREMAYRGEFFLHVIPKEVSTL